MGKNLVSIKSTETAIYFIQAVLSILLLAALCVFIMAQVIYRYVFNDPLFWTEELSRFLFVWLTFIGFGVAVHRKQEMRVAFFADMFSPRIRQWVSVISYILILTTCATVAFRGYLFALESYDVLSVAIELPWMWIFMAVPIGFGLVFVQYTLRLYSEILIIKGAKS